MTDYNEPMSTKQSLIDHLQYEVGVLDDPRIKEAFDAVDRADFVPEDYRPEVYEDYAVPIHYGQTISQPTVVAFMLEKLAPQPGDTVLDVGTGSGWTTALLAYLVGEEGTVIGKEIVPELASFGAQNLERTDVQNARIEEAGDTLGAPDDAPFDRILVSAAGETLPEELVKQLNKGGRMVIPIDDYLEVIEKHYDGSIERQQYTGFVFVPLR